MKTTFAIFRAFKLSKSFDLSAEGKFEEAYNNLLDIKIPSHTLHKYINFFLLRGYLAFATDRYEDAVDCFDLFFKEIEDANKYNDFEKLYLKAYVSVLYLKALPLINGSVQTEQQLYSFCNYKKIDLDGVSDRLKRNFPLRTHCLWVQSTKNRK